jgi:site-specific DNA-methyltransferase (adenine-specific)
MTWTLNLGSCLDPVSGLASLADKSVDVTITDPPYEAEAHTKQRRQKGKVTVVGREEYREVSESPLTFTPITARERAEAAIQIARVTRHAAIVFCQVEAVTAWRRALDVAGLRYRRTIPWVKPDAMPSLHGRWPGQSFEAIVLATAPGARACPVGGKALAYSYTRASGTAKVMRKGETSAAPHPTTKPLPLMRALVEHFSRPGDLVLDPFAGSGTTGIACNQLGRHFLGWELSPEYHAIATRRLNGDEAKPRPEQPSLFDAIGGR